MKHFDIAVVGGGMVGASLALMLRPLMRQGLTVALIDAQAIDASAPVQPSFDARTSALSLGTQRVFDRLGLWSLLKPYCNAIDHISVTQQGQFGRVRLHNDDCLVEALGQVIENRYLGKTLWQSLEAFQASCPDRLHLLAPAKLTALNMVPAAGQLSIEMDSGTETISASLIVLADGANSTGCQLLGIQQTKHDYQQQAVVVNVSFDRPHNNWAYERFTSQGPLAMLPLTDNRFGVVWCQSPEQTKAVLELDDDAFKAQLQKQVSKQLGRLVRVGERQSYPLALVKASEQVRSNVVVLGNAAHALHPVAGQGFNLALRDTQALAEQIERDFERNQLGNLKGLLAYAENQVADQNMTIGASHGLPLAFSHQSLLMSIARGAGMTLLDQLPVAKRLFARQAMGLTGSAAPWSH